MPQVDSLLATLRNVTADDVTAALEGAYVALPLTDADAVAEAVKRVVDHLYGEVET